MWLASRVQLVLIDGDHRCRDMTLTTCFSAACRLSTAGDHQYWTISGSDCSLSLPIFRPPNISSECSTHMLSLVLHNAHALSMDQLHIHECPFHILFMAIVARLRSVRSGCLFFLSCWLRRPFAAGRSLPLPMRCV